MQPQPAELAWRKSTRSAGASACVELAPLEDGGVAVRHSRTPDGPILCYNAAEWTAFLAGVKAGEFDSLVR